jgi:hypothetical protein
VKVLLDECVPERLRAHLTGHAGVNGRKNGEFLRLAEEAGYDVLLTVDQGVPHHLGMSGRRIAVIVLRAPGNDIDTLKQMVKAAGRSLNKISAGEIIELEYSATRERSE